MFVLLYNIIISLYSAGIRFASLFSDKASLFLQERRGLMKHIIESMSQWEHKSIWVHCASLGEFEQARPVIELLKERLPHSPIILTFYSPSGYRVRKNYTLANKVFYLPTDSATNASQFIKAINPGLAIFVKYEFWYHYITVLQRKKVPVLSISSIFRSDQIYFKFYGVFFQNILQKVSHFFVQDKTSAKLLGDIGITAVTVSGDTRFDRVYQLCNQEVRLSLIEKFKGEKKLFVLGSIWAADMDRISRFVNTAAEKYSLKFILAPHEIQESNIRKQIKDITLSSLKYSEAKEENVESARVLIIDNIGMLSSLYRYGDYAFIGGSFGEGLHNTLEAATFGLPLFFGNENYFKFKEANDLINLGGAFPVKDSYELMEAFKKVIMTEEKVHDLNSGYVKENTGAADKIVRYCIKLLEDGRESH